jgi:hypothetical protein
VTSGFPRPPSCPNGLFDSVVTSVSASASSALSKVPMLSPAASTSAFRFCAPWVRLVVYRLSPMNIEHAAPVTPGSPMVT